MIRWFYILLIFCLPIISVAQSRLHVASDKDSAEIADPIDIQIKLTYSASIGEINWPVFAVDSSIGGNFEIWKTGEIIKKSNLNQNNSEISITQTLTVATYKQGFIPFLPISILVGTDSIVSNAFLITVGQIKVDTTEAFNDIKPIMQDPLTFWESVSIWIGEYWWAVAILVVGIIIGLYFILRKRKPKLVPPTPTLPIYDRYQLALNQILEKELWKKGDVKGHYLALTDLTRSYFHERFRVSTFEKTTSEILSDIKSLPLGETIKPSVLETFRSSEFVKFAKQIPSSYEIEKHNQSIRDLIESTRPDETKMEDQL